MTNDLPLMHNTESNVARASHSFDVRDGKGRVLGARITTGVNTYAPAPEGSTWGYRRQPGSVFFFRPQATRDGVKYGALQRELEFATVEERDAAIAKYLDGARKRAAKAAAK